MGKIYNYFGLFQIAMVMKIIYLLTLWARVSCQDYSKVAIIIIIIGGSGPYLNHRFMPLLRL